MRKTLLFILGWLSLMFRVSAQYVEAGAYVGGSNYQGDLSEQKIRLESTGELMGVFIRYNTSPYFSLKTSLFKAMISGSDAYSAHKATRLRNLSFRSHLLELSFTGELNLSEYNIRAQKTGIPYVFAGLAITHFHPEAQMKGNWYSLRPLRTEGRNYSPVAIAIPLGIGFKFNLSYKVNFGLEIGVRKTFTDYLDDVSGRYPDIVSLRRIDPVRAALSYRTPELTGEFGTNPAGSTRGEKGNDLYVLAGLTISVNLTDKYGLDFDKRYEIFKTPPSGQATDTGKKQERETKERKNKKPLHNKKKFLEQQVKKRL